MEIKYNDWCIRRITPADIGPTLDFIIPMLYEVYPSITGVADRWDLAHMEEAYILPENAALFAAFDVNGTVAGTVAIRPYDDRIAAVEGCYDIRVTAELSRCYVKSSLRRKGIACQLVAAIREYCRAQGYQTICLHTHKFLPGGYPFWLSQGFLIRQENTDELETVYMDKDIRATVKL
jgi:GNAT superfamily N-acetyltransferase